MINLPGASVEFFPDWFDTHDSVIARLDRAIVRSRARSVQGGASPLQVNLFRPVANRNCVAMRRGGEQRKVNGAVRSESKLDSATLTGEPAIERRSPDRANRKPTTLRG